MSRKDYVALARAIRASVDHWNGMADTSYRDGVLAGIESTARKMVPVFKVDNRLFSADKFLVACGFEPTEGY